MENQARRCSLDWDELQPLGDGRMHCHKCSSVVIPARTQAEFDAGMKAGQCMWFVSKGDRSFGGPRVIEWEWNSPQLDWSE
jgi:hypothetical protein